MKTLMTYGIYLGAAFLPRSLKIFLYNKILGHEIHPTARIGFSYVHAKKIKMGPYSSIGRFNVIRNIELLELGERATFGHHNRANGLPLGHPKHFQGVLDRYPALILGANAAITGKHCFDCNDTISVGEFTTVAGQNSLFYTHGIDVETGRMKCGKIRIGKYCMVSARTVFIKGAILPDYCVLGANSTLHKAFVESYTLYSGVPAKPIMSLPQDSAYFHRTTGHIS